LPLLSCGLAKHLCSTKPKHGFPCGLGLAERGSGSEAGAANGLLAEGVQPEGAVDADAASGLQAEGMQLKEEEWGATAAAGTRERRWRRWQDGAGCCQWRWHLCVGIIGPAKVRGAPQCAQRRLGSADRPTRHPNCHDIAQVRSVAVANLRDTVSVSLPVICKFRFSLSNVSGETSAS
jgi:hypothetical protein